MSRVGRYAEIAGANFDDGHGRTVRRNCRSKVRRWPWMAGMSGNAEAISGCGISLAIDTRVAHPIVESMMKRASSDAIFAASVAAFQGSSQCTRHGERARNFAQFCANRAFAGHFLRRSEKKFRPPPNSAAAKNFPRATRVLCTKKYFCTHSCQSTSRMDTLAIFRGALRRFVLQAA